MKDKKVGTVLKTESKVIAYVVVCLVLIVLGISYALFFDVKGNEKNQIVKAGTLEFTYENGSQITNDTNSDCFIPMNLEDALKHSECEYKISITNAGTLPGNYSISLNSETVDKPLDLSKLKVILKKEGQVVADYPKDGTTTSLVSNEKIEAGKVVNYSIQVYVDKELVDSNDDEKNISIKINGDAVVNSEEVNPDSSILATDYITALSKKDMTNLITDDTSDANIRYVGNSPNNYIDIGDKDSEGNPILWRIIGVMNNITNLDNGGKEESLVKIIRAESIGTYSWDSSVSGVNNGFGINEWSQADVMKLLNPNTVYSGTPAIGGSLYWNRENGICYNTREEGNTTCEFISSGISDEAKEKIAKVRWNTGTFATYDDTQWTASATYLAERNEHNGKEECTSKGGGNYCNDAEPRTTTWDGYIGLIYLSDYGYAVGGSEKDTCSEKSVYNYDEEGCRDNNWLKPSNEHSWTITPSPYSTNASVTFNVTSSGSVHSNNADFAYEVLPVGYLKSSIKVISNPNPEQEYGSIDNPFMLQ